MANYSVAQIDQIPPQPCPCGFTRRAFIGLAGAPASVHCVEIQENARTHYHKKMTEVYVVLEGQGSLELDGELVPVKPMTAVLIRPGCRHRALGKLKIINVAMPAFDEKDEWFD